VGLHVKTSKSTRDLSKYRYMPCEHHAGKDYRNPKLRRVAAKLAV